MNRQSSPGVGQWFSVAVLVTTTIFLLIKLFQYATLGGTFPAGLTMGGVDVSRMTPQQASEVLTNRYVEAPIVIYHQDQSIEISPTEAEFQLDIPAMLERADYERSRQDFWAGFWGFLWGRPIQVSPVPVQATHDREALIRVLTEIRTLMDTPAQPPQPDLNSLSFLNGQPGMVTNVEASLNDVEAALYRHNNREAHLVVEPKEPERPDTNLLIRLLVNELQDFEQQTGGVGSVFIMDLESGEEIAINADAPMSGIDLLKVPIVLETFRLIDRLPTVSQNTHISNTLALQTTNESANALLVSIAGQDDPYLGAQLVTESMQRLGLVNTFIMLPYDTDPRAGMVPPETPANSAEVLRTRPNPYIQTTAEDMGTLLSMIYHCAEGMGGTLQAVYGDELTETECQTILAYMKQNKIGSLIEEGVPPETAVAHRHGWISDTHGDAGIVYAPDGDYVMVQMLYKPDWLEWEISSPLLADISRATYNFFNFDTPYLGNSQAN